MRAGVFCKSGKWIEVGQWLCDGLARHGYEATRIVSFDGRDFLPEYDLYVMVGRLGVCAPALKFCEMQDRPNYLFVDHAYTAGGRWKYCRITHNALQQWWQEDRPDDRWDAYRAVSGDSIQPWREGGEYVLLSGISKYEEMGGQFTKATWVEAMAGAISKAMPGVEVMYRPKPVLYYDGTAKLPDELDVQEAVTILSSHGIRSRLSIPGRQTLQEALSEAMVFVADQSAGLNEALLQGVPIASGGKSAASPLDSAELAPSRFPDPARLEWISSLCYGQWAFEELAGGEWVEETLEKCPPLAPCL